MDLTFHTDQAKLNIRVAVILKNEQGYIFCESKEGYYFAVGGRVKMNESSLEAAHREVLEELGHEMKTVKFVAVLENFFIHETAHTHVHEYCFVYQCEDIITNTLPEFFVSLSKQEVVEKDVRPNLIQEIISYPPENLIHRISK